MYHAKIHPEQYSHSFTPDQLKQLHTSMLHVCQTAVDLLADSSKFPEDWLFKHRWGKGKKDAPNVLPNGEKIIFLTVGGRTSCVVPGIQKKTGPTADEMKSKKKPKKKQDPDGESDETNGTSAIKESKKNPSRAKKSAAKYQETSDVEEAEPLDEVESKPKLRKANTSKKRKTASEIVDEDDDREEVTPIAKSKSKRRKTNLDSEIKPEDEDVKPKPRARTKKTSTIEESSDVKSVNDKLAPKVVSKKRSTVKDEPDIYGVDLKKTDGRRRSGRVSK